MLKTLCHFLFASFLGASLLFAQNETMDIDVSQNETPALEGKQEDPDMDALRKWIRQKRLVTVKEIGGDLSLSGEVRAEMQAIREIRNGVKQRGPNSESGKPDYSFDIEANILLDYRAERTWASIKIEFDNDMGQVSGTTNRIALERAYFGGRMINGNTVTFDGEIGRRYLGNIFDSKIEFSSLFDGLLLKFSKASDAMGDFYINSGVFIINDEERQFGFIAEMGMLNIGNTGLYTKYSIVDWKEHKYPEGVQWNRYNYIVSQLILGYQFTVSPVSRLVKFYAAALYNHAAKKILLSDYKKANQGYYAGVSVGQVRKRGDWAFDFNYQYVMPQAIPDFDVGGIKRGNAMGVGFFTQNLNGTGAEITRRQDAVGSCNYHGFSFEFLYALSNNLTWQNSFQWSRNQTRRVGPHFKYRMYEMEFIYAF